MGIAPGGGNRGVLARFVHSQTTGSVVVLVCTIAALGRANSPWAESHFRLEHKEFRIKIGQTECGISLHDWINDFGIVLFSTSQLDCTQLIAAGAFVFPDRPGIAFQVKRSEGAIEAASSLQGGYWF